MPPLPSLPRVLLLAVTLGGCSDRTVEAIVGPAASCAQLRARGGVTTDGPQAIDPDGPGGTPPIQVVCVMSTKGGGWTQVLADDFSRPPALFNKNTTTGCGAFGLILGGYRTLGNETITASLDLKRVPHTELRIRFDLVVLDSWDGEVAFVEVDGRRVWSIRCDKSSASSCNQRSDQCGWDGTDRNDGKVPVDIVLPHTEGTAVLRIGAILDQNSVDESWGLDDLQILVR